MSITEMKKIVHLGDKVYIRILFKDKRLSIVGVDRPLRNGDCVGNCCQIVDDIHRIKNPKIGRSTLLKVQQIWKRWHLNDMRAGNPVQEEFLRANGRCQDYTETCKKLEEAGILEHDGYRYGSKWLFEEVPQDVLEFLNTLPETDNEVAIQWLK